MGDAIQRRRMDVVRRLRTMDTRPIEFAYCILTLTWGFGLLVAKDGFGGMAAFRPMASIMPAHGWGALAMAIGTFRVGGVIGDVLALRLLAAMGGGIIWTFTACTMFGAFLHYGGAVTGVTVYGPLALINFGVFVKLCRSCLPTSRGARVADA